MKKLTFLNRSEVNMYSKNKIEWGPLKMQPSSSSDSIVSKNETLTKIYF